METKPVTEEYFETLVWPNFLRNNYHLASMKKNREKKLGGDILVLDSTKETPDEMLDKTIKFIFNKKDIKRDLKKEQELLNDIEKQYNDLIKNKNEQKE
jgi:hypothetical protein